jgi:hypothetical protein
MNDYLPTYALLGRPRPRPHCYTRRGLHDPPAYLSPSPSLNTYCI